MLKIAEGLSLPAKAVTQTFAILAMRGVGKTYTASVLAEEFSKAALPFAVLDPTGAWWGLRASADGKGAGYPVTILGGDHGDIPLEESAGKIIAALLAEEAPQLVLDLSLFSKGAMRRFVADFAEELYRKNRNPLHLIMDEADAFCPQKPRPDEMRMLGAIDEIVRRGRIRGLGCTLVTQRSAVLNKDVLTQMEVLIALRTAHPRDRAPVLEWMKVHATDAQLERVTETLATLPLGDAWIMSAGWLDLFKRVHVRKRETFNSSATPEPGQRRIEPKQMADVDLAALRERMAATIERAKADDPRELRRRISVLEADLRKPRQPEVDVGELEKAARQAGRAEAVEWIRKAVSASLDALKAMEVPRRAPIQGVVAPVVRRPVGTIVAAPSLNAGMKKILIACAQYPHGATREQLTILTGYKTSSRNTYLQRLQAMGCVMMMGSRIVATDAGRLALGDSFMPLPTGGELRRYWLERLPEGERKIFGALVEAYPRAIMREELDRSTGYKTSSRNTYLQRLRSRQLVEISGATVTVREELFV